MWVYLFSEVNQAEAYVGGDWDKVRGLLGGKGKSCRYEQNWCACTSVGFTVTTEACNEYSANGKFPDGMWDQMLAGLSEVEKEAEKKSRRFEKSSFKLLPFRCKILYAVGMMDTVLNIGLNDETAKGMVELTGNERFVYDSYRRLIQMFGSVVLEIPDEAFENPMDSFKESKGYKLDTEMTASDLKELTKIFKDVVKSEKGFDFPQDPL